MSPLIQPNWRWLWKEPQKGALLRAPKAEFRRHSFVTIGFMMELKRDGSSSRRKSVMGQNWHLASILLGSWEIVTSRGQWWIQDLLLKVKLQDARSLIGLSPKTGKNSRTVGITHFVQPAGLNESMPDRGSTTMEDNQGPLQRCVLYGKEQMQSIHRYR